MKKKIILGNVLLAAGALLSSMSVTSCCGEDVKIDMPAEVKAYYDKDIVSAEVKDMVSAYFDLSNGIIEAYKTNPNAEQVMKQTVNRLTSGENCTVYSMADDKIEPLELKQTALYNKIVDASSYSRQMAPIEKTLSQIVAEGKSALLVTDFEEYTPDKRVQHASFAAPYFQKWLQAGKDITFFIFNYTEGKAEKHLYFIVFDNKQHNLLKLVRESMSSSVANGEFTLSPDAYSCTTEYPSAIKGGNYHMADNAQEDIVTNVIETGTGNCFTAYGEGSRVEYYPIGDVWENILMNAKGASEIGNTPVFTDLLRNLFFDFSNQDSYIIKKLDVRVTNVQNDFMKFVAWSMWNKDKQAYSECYESIDEKGEPALLEEHDYSKGPATINEIKDMFAIDQKLFEETFQQSEGKKTEIGIVFSPNFNGKPVGAEDTDMLRIDVVIAESEPNLSPRLDELFVFNGNNNLRDAITVTLQNMNPRGTIIYTYFLKMAEE